MPLTGTLQVSGQPAEINMAQLSKRLKKLTWEEAVRAFLLADARQVLGIFGAMGAVVLLGTAAAFTLAAVLALVAWVPIVGLLFVPLQVAFWLLRGLLFQYVSLTT